MIETPWLPCWCAARASLAANRRGEPSSEVPLDDGVRCCLIAARGAAACSSVITGSCSAAAAPGLPASASTLAGQCEARAAMARCVLPALDTVATTISYVIVVSESEGKSVRVPWLGAPPQRGRERRGSRAGRTEPPCGAGG